MRHFPSAGLRAGLIAVVIAFPIQAAAQSFLQNLFGLGQPAYRPELPASRPGAPAYSNTVRPDQRWSRETRRYSPAVSEDARSDASDDTARAQSQTSGGKYRTLCVRTCDGYYFPIGNAVSRHRFMRDAAQCRASCGEDARLFYLPSGSDNVSTMLDLAGRSYVRMSTAFKYRKSLTDGCTCRPMPWSAAEQQRHQRYAEEAARTAAEADAKRLAADEASKPVQAPVATAQAKQVAAAGRASPPNSAEVTRSAAAAAGMDAEAHAAMEATVADAGAPNPAERVEPIRQAAAGRTASNRGLDRPQPARRQQAVARVTGAQAGGASWFAPSNAKYTWPGDTPRR